MKTLRLCLELFDFGENSYSSSPGSGGRSGRSVGVLGSIVDNQIMSTRTRREAPAEMQRRKLLLILIVGS